MSKKYALLLFSKPPVPGMVKTRLTVEFGGIFTPELSAELFRRSMLDVTELCMRALLQLKEQNAQEMAADPSVEGIDYDFFVSTCPDENVELMRSEFEKFGPWPLEIQYITDHGTSFNEHFNDAFQQIFDLGYDGVLSVGGDIPTMPITHVTTGFAWMDYFYDAYDGDGAVLAPCQECGVSLIGINRNAKINHNDVFYNMSGRAALDAYREMAEEFGTPIAFMDPVADIDDPEDLAHATTLMRAIRYCSEFQPDIFVPLRTLQFVDAIGVKVSTPPNDDFDPRDDLDV
ncbi:MAG: DUF2064 domain-containing protein [Coriobacteriales bacterium]|nr:DUF2064 domain-containing protein [Coriobacteriales bacterium]